MNRPVCYILLVEDDEDDFLIIEDLLKNVRFCIVRLHWVSSYEEAIIAIHIKTPDILLADYNLNYTHTGADLVREVKDEGVDIPSILVTTHQEADFGDEEIIELFDGYLHKGNINSAILEEMLQSVF